MTTADSGLFRVYEPAECGQDGYPVAWHSTIKHDVRAEAGHRCVRCKHPYLVQRKGNVTTTPGHERRLLSTGKYAQVSRCDDECRHGGPVLYWTPTTGWGEYDGPDETIANEVYAIWRILTVHHLDGQKRNCRWWNLVALCQRCHLTIQGRVKMEIPWPWEHTAWFKPYVAGFYAWEYLNEELTRVEVEARMAELLDLGGNTPRLFA